jgi:predicted dehydrogenase
MSRQYRIGIIGTGHRAHAFVPQLKETTPRARLLGLCDADPDRLREFVERNKLDGVPAFDDIDAFLAQPELDAVIATVPEFAHRDVAVKVMQAGKPLYLEKPLAHTLDAAYDMIEAQRQTGSLVFLGFNLRASPAYIKLREVIQSGVLGQILHIEGIEQLHVAHIASFMRRFHRKTDLNGGFLNAKCCHDLDIMMWLVGHQHRVVKISSFGGCNVFRPEKQPATHCRLCPADVYRTCPYKAPNSEQLRKGTIALPTTNSPDIYPGDLCVYTPDKDIVDNQTVILEWEHGVRGNFNLQGFQHQGNRMSRIWGEHAVADFDGQRQPHITVMRSDSGDTAAYHFQPRKGGHGGTDSQMIDRFLDAIESGDVGDSGLKEGLAATLLAIKADESRLTGRTIEISKEAYGGG